MSVFKTDTFDHSDTHPKKWNFLSREGFEPSTQGFSVLCSNQLSYLDFLYSIKKYIICKKNSGVKGFEPLNVGSKFRCLTTWLHPMHVTHNMQKHLLKLRLLSLLITKIKNKISED